MCVPSPPSLGARLHPPRPLVLLHAACGGVARAAGARAAVALRAAALPARARAVPRAVGRDARRGASASGGGLIARWLETSQGSLGAASRVRGRGSPFRLDLWVHATAVGGGSECGPRVHELGYPRPTRTTLWPCARRGGTSYAACTLYIRWCVVVLLTLPLRYTIRRAFLQRYRL